MNHITHTEEYYKFIDDNYDDFLRDYITYIEDSYEEYITSY